MGGGDIAHGVQTALIIGAFPTGFMILASILLTNIEVGEKVEAAVQNFAAGLIIAAVGGELFPSMLDADQEPSFIGISCGMFLGLAIIYGLEMLIEYLENIPENLFGELGRSETNSQSGNNGRKPSKELISVKSFPKGLTAGDIEGLENGLELTMMNDPEAEDTWEDEPVQKASLAISSSPHHRDHIKEHLEELMATINEMEKRAIRMMEPDLPIRDTEALAEYIDEHVHSVQYKLDHCRRLLQGSETENIPSTTLPAVHQQWMTEDRKRTIQKGLNGLHLMVEHLLEHIQEPNIDGNVLKEMHIHMDYMDKQIESFHRSIENAASKWYKASRNMIITQVGDKVPLRLVLPVTMDALVDGFLIGLSSSINFKAGVILGLANSLEMSFLGMAYASRLVKCTGSGPWTRFFAIYSPPLIMLLASALGAAVGDAVHHISALYIALVAFGSVALLFLVCNELLIEAREAQGDDEKWYISATVFLGVYVVLMTDHIL